MKSPGRFTARVRMSKAHRGPVTVPLTPEIVRAPFGVEVLSLEPSQLDLTLEEVIAREVPIVANIEGVPAAGFELHSHTLRPDRATLEGPESVFRGQVVAVTSRIDVTGRRSTFSQDVEVRTTHPDLRVVQPRTVRATVQIVPASSLRSPEGQ